MPANSGESLRALNLESVAHAEEARRIVYEVIAALPDGRGSLPEYHAEMIESLATLTVAVACARRAAKERRNFRWAYAAVVALAKERLREANEARESPAEWPAGQEWAALNGSSKSIFMRRAREELGIPHNEFLEGVRGGEYDVDDLFEEE